MRKFPFSFFFLLAALANAEPPKKQAPAPAAKPAPAPHAAPAAPHAVPANGVPRGVAQPNVSHTPAPNYGTPRNSEPAPRRVFGSGGSSPAARSTYTSRTGSEVHLHANGRPADIRTHNMAIHHDLAGGRRVEVMNGNRHIVAERGGRGFVEGPYRYGGHEFAHRTYLAHGRAYDRFYAAHSYHGVLMNVYTPSYYYRPAFYSWVYNPWATPIAFAWGFGAYPWYGYYGPYFAPYPIYPSASFWLTDYLYSQSLAAAYEAQGQMAAGIQIAAADAVTAQVKDMAASEVQRQIIIENAETLQNGQIDTASSGIQRMLSDNVQHIFVAGRGLDLVDNNSGQECAVTQGDTLQLIGPPPPDATTANLTVLSSKGGVECRRGAVVAVAFTDLQDMQNHMRETIDQGMQELQSRQGSGGVPPLPPAANVPPARAAFASAPDAPGPDTIGVNEIAQQSAAADQEERQAMSEVPAPAAMQAAPMGPVPMMPQVGQPANAPVAVGQTEAQVIGVLGNPLNVVNLGANKVYLYNNLRVVFQNGVVIYAQ